MSKKVKEVSDALASVRAEYKDCFISGESLLSRQQTIIPFSLNLDGILGGGIPLGSFVVIAGQKKLGKTTSILQFCANAQKQGCKVYYLDIEYRLKGRDLSGIPGLQLTSDKFVIVHSTKNKKLHGEDYLTIAMDLLENEENCIIVLDSISQLCSSGKAAANIGDRFRDDTPSMLSTLTKRASNLLPVNNHILICVTHLIANQGGHGPALWIEASGQKVQYQADVKLKATHITVVTDTDDKQVGQEIHWNCDTSALGPPGGKTTTLLRYGEGLDDYYDLLTTCIDIGLVAKGGAWLTFPGGERAQGKEKGRTFLKENPLVYNALLEAYKEMVL
jgi:recombination protein RecA